MSSSFARHLRRNQTDAERLIWSRLRNRQLGAYHFRRQSPIGSYVVDFLCHECRLVVEVDGGQHATQQSEDDKRTTWLESEGFRMIRFWNNEVLGNIDGVLEEIRATLRKH